MSESGACTIQASGACLACCELPALLFCEHFPPLDLRHRNPDIELRDLLLDISALLRSCELSNPPTSWKLTSNSLVYVMLWLECLELTSDGLCALFWVGTCSALAKVMPLSGWMSSLWMLLPLSRSHFRWRGVAALHTLCVVGLDIGSMEAFGRPRMPLENTEKKGLAQGTVAEITLTWQASIDMTCNRTTEFAGLALKTLECMGRSREALGAIRSRRNANAITTLAFVFNGMLMSHTR